jgi:hypothetical protein
MPLDAAPATPRKHATPSRSSQVVRSSKWSAYATYAATARQPSQWIMSEGWLTSLDNFRPWLIREAA